MDFGDGVALAGECDGAFLAKVELLVVSDGGKGCLFLWVVFAGVSELGVGGRGAYSECVDWGFV